MLELITFHQTERSSAGKQFKTNNVANGSKLDYKRSFSHS